MCGNSHTPSCIPNYIPHTAIIIVFIITSIHVRSLKNDWGKHLELLFWIVIWFHVRAWGGDRPYIFRLSLFRPGVSCEPGMAQKPPYQQLVKTARPPYTHNNRRWFSWNWTQMSLKKRERIRHIQNERHPINQHIPKLFWLAVRSPNLVKIYISMVISGWSNVLEAQLVGSRGVTHPLAEN